MKHGGQAGPHMCGPPRVQTGAAREGGGGGRAGGAALVTEMVLLEAVFGPSDAGGVENAAREDERGKKREDDECVRRTMRGAVQGGRTAE